MGNNATLAKLLGIRETGPLDPLESFPIGNVGELDEPVSLITLGQRIDSALGRQPLLISGGDHPIRTVGWCTGGAQSYIDKAVCAGVDVFISGEISESTVHPRGRKEFTILLLVIMQQSVAACRLLGSGCRSTGVLNNASSIYRTLFDKRKLNADCFFLLRDKNASNFSGESFYSHWGEGKYENSDSIYLCSVVFLPSSLGGVSCSCEQHSS